MNQGSDQLTRLGPYELVERIAAGGMAEVYLARREGPHGFTKLVAVKRILPQLASDPDFVAMFVDEARVCARLAHPNIVQVFDFGEERTPAPDGKEHRELYMAMEYVDGTTGARLIRAAAAKGEDIPLEVSLHVALSVLRGLDYAHRARDEQGRPLRIVHRDVSPGNVLLDRSGAVKLTDFGIARAAEFERRTDAGQLKGKLGYMSPEQVVGRDLDGRSDLFTLGIVLAEMVMLRPLFAGGRELDVLLRIRDADLSSIDASSGRVPDDVRQVLFRALAKDREHRYATAGAFAEALEDIVRRRRLQVGPSKLAAWIARLGLAARTDPAEDTTASRRESSAVLELRDAPAMGPEPPSTSQGAQDVAPKIYRVMLEGGSAVGPISYPKLVELFATGRVGASTTIARESGSFREAASYAELSRFVTSPALRWDDDLEAGATLRGPIDRLRLPAILRRLAVERETGALVLRDGARRKKIYFVEGKPEFVTSTDKRELLGERLVARGQVLRMEVDMALAMLPRFGGRLGDALVGLAVLRPIELFRAIHQQTEERYLEVFKWAAGELAFARGARSQEETFPLAVDPFELIARGVQAGYAAEEIEALLAPLADRPLEPVVMPPIRVEAFRLDDKHLRVLRRVDGERTLPDLEEDASSFASKEDVRLGVFLGLSCGVLQVRGF